MNLNILLPLNLIDQFFFSRNGIVHVIQLGKKVMAKGKRQKIKSECWYWSHVLFAGFAAHFEFTNRQVIYQNHLLQKYAQSKTLKQEAFIITTEKILFSYTEVHYILCVVEISRYYCYCCLLCHNYQLRNIQTGVALNQNSKRSTAERNAEFL